MSEREDFGEKLSALCARELPHARRDPDRIAAMVEALIGSLALAIAVATKGDAKAANTMLEGSQSYLYDRVAGHADIGKFMGGFW